MTTYRNVFFMMILTVVAAVCFVAGMAWGINNAHADEPVKPKAKVVYPKKTDLNFEGANIEGEVHNPAEFYFQHRPEQKFDSLVKRRPNFQREMLRDVVLSK